MMENVPQLTEDQKIIIEALKAQQEKVRTSKRLKGFLGNIITKKNYTRTCQMVAPSNRVLVDAFFKNLPLKSPHFEKSRVKIPLVMGGPLP